MLYFNYLVFLTDGVWILVNVQFIELPNVTAGNCCDLNLHNRRRHCQSASVLVKKMIRS
jgi:hypothetical protein